MVADTVLDDVPGLKAFARETHDLAKHAASEGFKTISRVAATAQTPNMSIAVLGEAILNMAMSYVEAEASCNLHQAADMYIGVMIKALTSAKQKGLHNAKK